MPRLTAPKVLLLGGIVLAFVLCLSSAQLTAPSATTSVGSIDWSKSETMTVTMTAYTFIPHRLTIRLGVPTRLRLVNDSVEIHDFTAPDFFKTIDVRDQRVFGSSGIGIQVDPKEQKDVEFVARVPGHFGLICADHDWAGMTADIVVK
jgi:plastocyanin